MCGIIGELFFQGGEVDLDRLTVARDVMGPRGPDAQGLWSEPDGSVAFGHRRLAVIDLDARSNQPFIDASNRFVLVYNGEVYNFRELRTELQSFGVGFITTSDTEVVLHALITWGAYACARFNGMFAFGLWDRVERRLLLGRDRLGVKPLYVDTRVPGRVAFASTLAPLLELARTPVTLDVAALSAYLQTLCVPGTHSAVNGIRPVPSGMLVTVSSSGQLVESRWWNPLTEGAVSLPTTDGELVSLFDSEMRQAVKRRLVSDVPVGVLLSGGVDSSLVAAYMREEASGTVDAFTIAFESQQHDESEVASAVARRLGVRHHIMPATERDLLELVEQFPLQFDEPFADVSAFPTLLLSRMTRTRVTVALCGDGGDELFGGYNYYRWLRMYERAFRLPRVLRRPASRLGSLFGSRVAMISKGLACEDLPAVFAFMRSTSKGVDWNRLLKVAPFDVASRFRRTMARPGVDGRLRAMSADLIAYLPDDILVKGDRASMAASLEVRHPFLDINVVRHALVLSPDQVFRRGRGKWLLREILRRFLPADITERPKHGFTVPIRQWLRGKLRPLVTDALAPREFEDDPLIDANEMSRVVAEHMSGQHNHENLIWAVLMYRLWLRQFSHRITGCNVTQAAAHQVTA